MCNECNKYNKCNKCCSVVVVQETARPQKINSIVPYSALFNVNIQGEKYNDVIFNPTLTPGFDDVGTFDNFPHLNEYPFQSDFVGFRVPAAGNLSDFYFSIQFRPEDSQYAVAPKDVVFSSYVYVSKSPADNPNGITVHNDYVFTGISSSVNLEKDTPLTAVANKNTKNSYPVKAGDIIGVKIMSEWRDEDGNPTVLEEPLNVRGRIYAGLALK